MGFSCVANLAVIVGIGVLCESFHGRAIWRIMGVITIMIRCMHCDVGFSESFAMMNSETWMNLKLRAAA